MATFFNSKSQQTDPQHRHAIYFLSDLYNTDRYYVYNIGSLNIIAWKCTLDPSELLDHTSDKLCLYFIKKKFAIDPTKKLLIH